jgi:hypothetical protein
LSAFLTRTATSHMGWRGGTTSWGWWGCFVSLLVQTTYYCWAQTYYNQNPVTVGCEWWRGILLR